MVGKGVYLGAVASVLEVNQRVASHVFGKPGTAITKDASFAVQIDVVGDRDGLLEMPLLFNEPALARTESHGVILERALATLVAYGAVERMVDQEKLENAVLGLLGHGRFGLDHHVWGDGDHAAGLEGGAAAGVDLYQAHPAHADGLHAVVVTKARDINPVPLGNIDHQLAWASLNGLAVDGDGNGSLDGCLDGCFRHRRWPLHERTGRQTRAPLPQR